MGKISDFCHLIGKLQGGEVRAEVKGNEWRVSGERGQGRKPLDLQTSAPGLAGIQARPKRSF